MRVTRRFTMYELLAIMAVFALLLGLMPPAVLRVQDRARNTRSQNNLKQIGISAHNFYDTMGHFPAGNDANNYLGRGVLAAVYRAGERL